MKPNIIIFVIIEYLNVAVAFQQEITFYTGADYTGESITFKSTKSDLTSYGNNTILRNSKSYCVTGLWSGFEGKDGVGPDHGYGWVKAGRECASSTKIQSQNSLRHFGASETTTPSLRLNEGSRYDLSGGREYIVDGIAAAFIPFRPAFYSSTGSRNWTFFTGQNFDGNSTCVRFSSMYYEISWGSISGLVGSVIRGCDFEATSNLRLYLVNSS